VLSLQVGRLDPLTVSIQTSLNEGNLILLGTPLRMHGRPPQKHTGTAISSPLWILIVATECSKGYVFLSTQRFFTNLARFQLGLTTAPVVYVYHATEGPRQPANGKYGPLKFDFST